MITVTIEETRKRVAQVNKDCYPKGFTDKQIIEVEKEAVLQYDGVMDGSETIFLKVEVDRG